MNEFSAKFFRHPWWACAVALAITAFFCFFKLGSNPLYEWDESMHGELALEMLRTGDWLNYYFAGEPETWFAKPPFGIWAIAFSFKLLGANEWALRLPSACAALLAFFFIFKIVRLYRDNAFAFFTTLMLVSINGLICIHVGRSGDLDALLLLFLMGSTYHFLKFIDYDKKASGIWMGLFLGLAFLTKGAASVVLLPAWFLYLLHKRQLKAFLMSWQAWLGLAILILMASAWL